MDEGYAMAMWINANGTACDQRIIQQYLKAFFGKRFAVPDVNMLGMGHVANKYRSNGR